MLGSAVGHHVAHLSYPIHTTNACSHRCTCQSHAQTYAEYHVQMVLQIEQTLLEVLAIWVYGEIIVNTESCLAKHTCFFLKYLSRKTVYLHLLKNFQGCTTDCVGAHTLIQSCQLA